jgi:hypothetical protein
VKKKQKKFNKKRIKNAISISISKRKNSVFNLNDDANAIKKNKRRSLFYKEKY